MSTTKLDKKYLWHPFTQMADWMAPGHKPVVIVEGRGAVLRDEKGNEYIDGNSSIWTNLHGHRQPKIDAAIGRQLKKIAHSSFLGLTNEVAPRLAKELVDAIAYPKKKYRVFLSDDGSTAIEAGLKMMIQARDQRGETKRKQTVSLAQGYHGDTIGAMSLSHSKAFHRPFAPLMFPTREAMSPACYRCPYNKARPVRGQDARETRKCKWECVDLLKKALDKNPEKTAAFVMEPLVQGAAGMVMHPAGYLAKAAKLCRERGIWLMLDEVFTGFGRTGALFACQKENVQPDVIALAKGLTGGYLPLAATLASGEIFDAFLGDYASFKTFFHGHSYSGNPLGAAAALANMELLSEPGFEKTAAKKASTLRNLSQRFWNHPNVGDVRQEGFICAIELVADFASRKPFAPQERIGARVCEAAKKHGLLTRPLGNVLLLMPPYCITDAQMKTAVDALWAGLCEVLPLNRSH